MWWRRQQGFFYSYVNRVVGVTYDAWDTIAPDQLDRVAESQAVYLSKQNKKTEKLVDK
jgi:hypothetical protein